MRYVIDMKHAKHTNVYIITKKGLPLDKYGKIVVNWSDSGNPTAGVWFEDQYGQFSVTGSCGYDIEAHAIAKAFNQLGFSDDNIKDAIRGGGLSCIHKMLEVRGYELTRLL